MLLLTRKVQLNRNELSGSFGDIGTDLPLIVAMLAATDLNGASVLIVFGVLQIITAFTYGMPMPVQPLKAVAAIVITQNISSGVIFGGGLAIGVVMLLLTVTGLLSVLGRVIPKTVIRGIQFGLGMQLCLLSLNNYITPGPFAAYMLAFVAFAIGVVFVGNKKYPPAMFIILAGFLYTIFFNSSAFQQIAFAPPDLQLPHITLDNVITGFVLLAIPQIPLSLGNSIFATNQLIKDYFPEKKITVKRIGLTYSLMNIISPLVGGIPTCHGSGGIAGHYTFGGRTGGSTFFYGLLYILLGVFFSLSPSGIFELFPKPILGVILLFEGIVLILLIKDIITDRKSFFIAVLVGIIAIGMPYGYLIGMITGLLLYYLPKELILKDFGK